MKLRFWLMVVAWFLLSLGMNAILVSVAKAGPFRFFGSGCPGGVCPTGTVEVPVTAEVAPAKEPTIDGDGNARG